MHPETEVLGMFPGAHRTPLMLDRVMFTRIPHERLTAERSLFQHKWFDYRFMHPTLATSYYAQCYKDAYRTMFRRHFDRGTADYRMGIKVEDIFEPVSNDKTQKALNNTISGCWRGRQVADAMGMPYPVYIELAMRKALGWSRKYLPRPAQLYSDQIIEAVEQGWQELRRSKFYVAADPRYDVTHWRNNPSPVHLAHESWVCTQIVGRAPAARSHLLAQHLLGARPLIRIETAQARFEADDLERARLEI